MWQKGCQRKDGDGAGKIMDNSGMAPLFQEEAAVENYFAGEGAEAVYAELRYVFSSESTLIVVTGEAGVGKTMLCRRLAQEEDIPTPVFFSDTVKSFGGVIAKVADVFGITFEKDATIDAQIDYIGDILCQKKVPVLLVFDQAENFYLATLERVRRFYDSLRKAGVSAYVLFVGRPEFLDNYKQLLICNFEPTLESFIPLGQLSFPEIGRYLWRAVEGRDDPGVELFFRPEFIENLYLATSGNYRAINAIANKWLAQPDDSAALIEFLQSKQQEKQQHKGRRDRLQITMHSASLYLRQLFKEVSRRMASAFVLSQRQSSQQKKTILLSVGGCVLVGVLLVLLFFFFTGGTPVVERNGEQSLVTPAMEEKAAEEEKLVVPVLSEKPQEVVVEPPVLQKENVVAVRQEEPLLQQTQEAADPDSDEKVEQDIVQEKENVEKKEEKTAEAVTPALVISSEQQKVSFREEIDAADASSLPLLEEQKEEEEVEKKVEKQKEVVVLYPLKTSKYKDHVDARSFVNGNVTELERLIQNRFVAGMGWRNASKESLYTIRVAQLEGDEGQRLDGIFTDRKFRPMVADFYLFSKGLSPQYVIVFYGEFSSKEAAQKALHRVAPIFPDYSPLLMTIKEAMASVRDE